MPDTVAIPQPVTDEERNGVQAFLAWAHLEVDWAHGLAWRARKTVDTVCR